MLFERIESPGIAHYSYLVGDGTKAAVIDPRRDCDVYVEKASRVGMRIACILETHRNEDYVIGSTELADRTGAEVWHADGQLDYEYGQRAQDGQEWEIGSLKVEAVYSPGHTLGSMSYLLRDPSAEPWIVFTGDALFAGDVGRVDLLGMDRADEMAGMLYETLFEKLLALGDHVIVCPAHGTGSVCGSSIADRLWTTIGLERRLNPKLQHDDKSSFVANVVKELERPPYFDQMERLNVQGAPILGSLPVPAPLSASEFAQGAEEAIVLDTRMELGFGAAHVPGALSIWLGGLSSFAGWLLPYNRPILLVNESNDPVEPVRQLLRLGYDNVEGFLAGGMLAWHMAGMESESIPTITVQHLCRGLDEGEEMYVLDVRSDEEREAQGSIPDAASIHLTQLASRLDEIPKDRPITIFCGSGMRSMTAASLLEREGWDDLTVVLGGLKGWKSKKCPIELRS